MVLSQFSGPVNIFVSLAPQDKKLFEKLRRHLSVLKQQGFIHTLRDSLIAAESDVIDNVASYIRDANIIVLLISANFFASEQCVNVEMPCALEQQEAGDAHIIPVLLRPIASLASPLDRYTLLPPNGKAVSIWSNVDAALAEVVKGISRVIQKLTRRLTGTPTPVKPPQFPLSTLSLRRSRFFTDRDDTLATLHHYFTSEQTVQTRTQALYGLGGMGKTLLAVEYACLYHRQYQAILWLNASPRRLFSADILSLARQLGIPAQDEVDEQQRIAAIQRWLRYHDRWLLVLDNLDDFSLLDQLIPQYSSGHVLLITHSRTPGPLAHAVPVASMIIEDSALLLLRRAGIISEKGSRNDASEEDYRLAVEIAREVDGYPLALDQAGAHIEETQQTLATYLTRYRERRTALLGKRGRTALDHPDPVTTTLTLTFEKIAQINPGAMELLYLFAFLYPEALPDEMILHGASSLSDPLRTLAADPLALDASIATLLSFSLIQHRADTTTLNMHHIVQTILRQRLPKKRQIQMANQAVRLVNATFPEVGFTTWNICERYLPQVQHCATLIRDFRLTLKEGPLLLERVGTYYSQHGCYADAEASLTQALHLQERQPRGDPSDTAQILNSLGLLYQRQARYQDAEAYHRRALELRERTLGPEHPKTAESLHNLALVYGDQEAYQQAEQLYLHVIALEERAKGPDHPDVAKTLNNLALMYYHQGHYAQAETTYQRALTIYERSLAANHPDLVHPLDGLGALAEIQGHYQRAKELYLRAFAICEQAFGEMHPETAHCINKLAGIYELEGNHQEAETRYRQAIAIGEHVLGPEHPDVALFLNNLAFLLHRQGQYQQAEELYQRALRIYEQALGPEQLTIASVHSNLGQLYLQTNNEERAATHLEQALALYEKHLSPTHPDIAQGLSDLADLRTVQHRYEEAEPLLKRALAILSQMGFEHTEIALVREKYASLLERMHRNEEAAQLRQAAPQQEEQPPVEPPQDAS